MDLRVIAKKNWVKSKERPADIAIHSFYTLGHDKKYFRNMGINFNLNSYVTFKSGKIFFEQSDIKRAEKLLLSKDGSLPNYIKRTTDQFLKLSGRYAKFLNEIKSYNFKIATIGQIRKIFNEFEQHVLGLIPYSFIISIIFEQVSANLIKLELEREVKDVEKIYMDLMVNSKKNLTAEEYISKLKLAVLFKKKNNFIFEKEVNRHLKKYSWLTCYSPVDAPLTKENLVAQIKNIAIRSRLPEEIKKTFLEHQIRLKNAVKLLHSIKLSKKNKGLIKILQKNIWVRTYRRELMSYGFSIVQPMYYRIAEFSGFSFTDFANIACWEINAYSSGKKLPSKNEIKSRDNDFIIAKFGAWHGVITGKRIKRVKITESVLDSKKLFGQAVFPGKIIGEVFLIRSKEDVSNFLKGKILVAPTITTWMLPAVERCAGIITDAGGVLSHTAIVAREFRKPCIVGTKSATRLLKNGDKVEMDTSQSSIKLI